MFGITIHEAWECPNLSKTLASSCKLRVSKASYLGKPHFALEEVKMIFGKKLEIGVWGMD